MCLFCTAIPAAAAVGANLNAKQIAARQAVEQEGIEPPPEKPIIKATAGIIFLLAIGSLVSHAIISPIWKI
jgi:hypothetical protein